MKPYDIKNERKTEHSVDKIFIERWSSRSLSSDVSEKEFMSLLEAAKWAPSSSNGQPWRFIYAKNGSKYWNIFYEFLNDFNKIWCKNAGYLLVLLSRKKFEPDEDGKEEINRNHSFDSGSAWLSLALQARMKGLIAHAMAGFDLKKVREALKIPETYNIECMIAVGKQGEVEKSLPERMQKSEKPNARKTIKEISSEGIFPEKLWV